MLFPTELDQTTKDLFAGMESLGISTPKPKKRFSTAHVALQTAKHSQQQRFDTDWDLTLSTPKTPKPRLRTRREILDINSPPPSPRRAYPLAGESARKRARKLAQMRELQLTKADAEVDRAELAKVGRDISRESRSIQTERDSMMYPRPKKDFWNTAQDVLIAHGVERKGVIWETYAPKIESLLKQAHMSPGTYKKRDLDRIIMAAKESVLGTIPGMPYLDVPSETTERLRGGVGSDSSLEEGEIPDTSDEPQTTPPLLPVQPQAELTKQMIDLIDDARPLLQTVAASPLSPDQIQPAMPRQAPALTAEQLGQATAITQDEIDLDHASREDQKAPEIPQSRVDHLHAEIRHAPARYPPFETKFGRETGTEVVFDMPLPESPTMEAIVIQDAGSDISWNPSQGEFNPEFDERLADAGSVAVSQGTMERATDWSQYHGDSGMEDANLYGGHAGAREPHQFQAEVEDMYEREKYMHIIHRRPTFLATTNKKAVAYSNNPIKQSISMNFGALLSRDRNIQLRSGSILASRGRAVIKCRRKTPADVHAINGFLQTEFPYGAKVGGSKYSLVALIPKVLKSLPGTVTLSV